MLYRVSLALGLLIALASCGGRTTAPVANTPSEPSPGAPESPDDELRKLVEAAFERRLDRSPQMATRLGLRRGYDRWDDISEEMQQRILEANQAELERLRRIDRSSLSTRAQLTYDLFEYQTRRRIADHRWRRHFYPVNQMFGMQQAVPAFLINYHRIESESDAEAYIQRLQGVRPLFARLIEQLEARERLGVVPPKFVFPLVIEASQNVITGLPFEGAGGAARSPLYDDFRTKLEALKGLSEERKSQLVAAAEKALTEAVEPAYRELIAFLRAQQKRATTDHGVWKLPDGGAYYQHRLRVSTTTDMSADEIHQLGLREVARIHGEMRQIMEKVGFEGSLQEFFEHLRTDPMFYYPNTDEGRAAYLKEARAIIDGMRARLGELFITTPKAPLVVKRVEPFREKAAGKAFYNRPMDEGNKPGIYYANLYDMRDMPKYQMEALAYHEGIPGHHMQLAIAQELDELPKFRRFGSYTAYTEGWGLYAERIPVDMGLYSDPYSDFGRLAMELWRAARLVVDTGIHSQKWTRDRAIDYLMDNTPNPRGDAVKAIERYIVMPGQATAYKIGMNWILDLRARAEKALGPAFDLREFHEVVLTQGPVPLSILSNLVDRWIADKKKTSES